MKKLFWGNIEHLDLTRLNATKYLSLLSGALSRVDTLCMDAVDFEGLDLVIHECDEWRYDDRDPSREECGYLVAEGLTATGRHEDEDILSCEECSDDSLLLRTK